MTDAFKFALAMFLISTPAAIAYSNGIQPLDSDYLASIEY